MIKIISVVGARPNFMKIAPIHKAFQKYNNIKHLICHTGQHFDEKMSDIFFTELELPKPDFFLEAGGGSHAQQTANIMIRFEQVLLSEKPHLIIVVGDVNSTLACSITAIKLHIPVAHVEAGLRSFDNSMPEEINRKITDSISNYLFVTERTGIENLKNEGIKPDKIFFTGNVMIDSLLNYLPKTENNNILKLLGINKQEYILVTFHRPSNVDNPEYLRDLIDFLNNISKNYKILFPIHPRTKNNIKKFNLENNLNNNIIITEALGYLEFLTAMRYAKLVITDSGGIQEETTYLGIQCVTVRDTTERPITVEIGTNTLAGTNLKNVNVIVNKIINNNEIKKGIIPPLWDGKAADRIVKIINDKITII